MPRAKNIGFKRPILNESNISLAIEDIERGMTIETAAKKHTIAKTTLWRHYKRYQLSGQQTGVYAKNSELGQTQIFTDEEEIFLAEYIKTLAQLQYELDKDDIRKFVYLIARKNKKSIPKTWIQDELADTDWLMGFINRHPNVQLKPTHGQPCISNTTGFQPKIDFNVIPNNLNDSILLYLFTQIYHLMKLTKHSTGNENNLIEYKK